MVVGEQGVAVAELAELELLVAEVAEGSCVVSHAEVPMEYWVGDEKMGVDCNIKCHSEDPRHDSSNCPYTRSCRYCWSTYHHHHECPAPHLACSTTKCVIPLYHLNVGTICATSLLAGDDSYESRVAAGDYDRDLEGNITD